MSIFDAVIIGGGMVGAATALGLARQKKRVALVEAKPPMPFSSEQVMDLRISAISKGSIDLFKTLHAWDSVKNMRLCPYRRLETWEFENCRTRFNADDLGLEQLGYMVENRVLQLALWEQFEAFDNLTLFCPNQLKRIDFSQEMNIVTLDNGEQLETHWVFGCDGANSKVRDFANIGVTAWDYQHRCMLIHVETKLPQQDITWQKFTPDGPRSFLPLSGQQASLVWYDSPQKIKRLQRLSMMDLSQQIMNEFPAELGEIKAIQAGSFPLTRRHAQSYISQRCVLLGDAAHTINPLAGQGVNLGFKDVWALLEAIADQGMSPEAMKTYEKLRRADNLIMQTGMDVFYQGFRHDIFPLKLARNLGLKVAEHTGPLKQQVLKYALGIL